MSMTTTTQASLVPSNMDQAMRLAEMMSKGRLLPTHLQGQIGDCLMVVEQAMRWGMSPFAVAQSTSVIQGKLMFEGKLVAAAIHGSGILKGRLSYDYSGAGDARKVTVSGLINGEATPRTFEALLKDARTSNKMWQVQPDQQLAYFGARAWARRHVPEVMLGVYSPEEMETELPTVTVGTPTINIEPEAPPMAKRTVREFLDALEIDLRAADTHEDVMAIYNRAEVRRADDTLQNGAHQRLTDMLEAARARVADAGLFVTTVEEPAA